MIDGAYCFYKMCYYGFEYETVQVDMRGNECISRDIKSGEIETIRESWKNRKLQEKEIYINGTMVRKYVRDNNGQIQKKRLEQRDTNIEEIKRICEGDIRIERNKKYIFNDEEIQSIGKEKKTLEIKKQSDGRIMEGKNLYDGYLYEKDAEGWIKSYSYYEEGEKKEEVEFCRKGIWFRHYLKGELETMIEILDEEGRRTELKEVYLLGILLKQTKRNKETGFVEYKTIELSNKEKNKLRKEFLEEITQELDYEAVQVDMSENEYISYKIKSGEIEAVRESWKNGELQEKEIYIDGTMVRKYVRDNNGQIQKKRLEPCDTDIEEIKRICEGDIWVRGDNKKYIFNEEEIQSIGKEKKTLEIKKQSDGRIMEGKKLYNGYLYEKDIEGWIKFYSYYEEGEKKEEVEFCRKGRWIRHYLKGELETKIEILDEEGRTKLKEVYLLGILFKQKKRNKEMNYEYKELKLSNAEKNKLRKEFLEDIIQE